MPKIRKKLIFKISGRGVFGQRVMGISGLAFFTFWNDTIFEVSNKPNYCEYHSNLTISLKSKRTHEATNSSDSNGD